jgi:N-acetylglutamate synthase-like GNAT family acetyltransferase
MSKVRLACIEDIPALHPMAVQFTSAHGLVEYDEAEITNTLTHLIVSHTFLVLEDNGIVVGVAAAIVAPCIWNRKQILFQELCWWVEPEHRGFGGIKLLKALEACAPEGATVVLSTLANSPIKASTLEKLNYIAVETAYKRI